MPNMTALFPEDYTTIHGAHGVVVSRPLRMRKALGSNPSVSIFLALLGASGQGLPNHYGGTTADGLPGPSAAWLEKFWKKGTQPRTARMSELNDCFGIDSTGPVA